MYCPYENVSCLLFVAFWWKEVVFFSSFRQFKPIAVPRPVVLRQVQTLRVHTNDWAVACSVQQWVWSTLPVRSLSRCSLLCARGAGAWSLEHACLVLNCCKQLSSWPCTQRPSRVGSEATRSASAQRHSRCRILSQNVQLSTNDRAFARRVSSVTCTTWVRSLHTPASIILQLPQHFSQLEARNTDDDNAKQQKRKIEYSSIRSLSHVHQFRTPCSNRRRKGQFSTRPRGTIADLAQTNAIFSLHNRTAGRGPYISYGRNLWTCLNRPEQTSDFRLQRHIFKQDCRKSKPILVGLRSCRWEVWDITSRKGRERKKKQ